MKQKIIITGGAGYIGSHTIIELIKSGKYIPVAVDSCVRSTPETFQRIKKITGEDVTHYKIDICDKDALFDVIKKEGPITGIIHFAAYKSVPESVDKPLMYYHNNLVSMINVMEGCQQFGIPYFIYSSSCSIYGAVEQLPVDESTPVGVPFCPYAHTKQIGEEMLRSFSKVNPQVKSVILRYFNPVGSDMSGMNGELSPDKPNNLMPIITQVGIGKLPQMTVFGTDYPTRDGSCIRDYVHVSDIADAHGKALEYVRNNKNETNCDVFNLGTGEGVSVLEMVHAFERLTNIKLKYVLGQRRQGDIPAIYSNSRKANDLLNWHCRYGLDDMITSAWKWENYLKTEVSR